MADSIDEEYDPQPSIPKNANMLQPIGTRIVEARRRLERESPEFLRENALEDESEAAPQKTLRQTAGLRDRSRTELRSRNQRRKVNGGNQNYKFKGAECVHPRRSEYGNNGGTALGRAARENSRQLDRNTMPDISYIEGFQGRSSEESRRRVPASLIEFRDRLADYDSGDFESSDSEGSPAPGNLKAISRPARKSAAIVIKRPDGEALDVESFKGHASSENLYHPDDYAAPTSPDETLSASSVLLLKFSSISNHTISKDKTQGEEAHNSELLAAFGQKIQARCFREISNQSVNLAEHQSPLSKTATLGTSNGSFATRQTTQLISDTYPYRMAVMGLPTLLSLGAVKNFVCQADLESEAFSVDSIKEGIAYVDFKTTVDCAIATRRLRGRDFRGARVSCSMAPPPPPGWYKAPDSGGDTG
jgi:hypothetical protein